MLNKHSSRVLFTSTDVLLVLLVLIWGANFSVVKVVVTEIPSLAFNAIRILTACFVLVVTSRLKGESLPERRDWPHFAMLGFLGYFLYQILFVTGLEKTTVTNSSLILGCMPFAVIALNAISGQRESFGWRQWVGFVLATVGVGFVVGQGGEANLETFAGDAMIFVALWAWAFYTSGSRSLLDRYSPLQVSTYATVVGALLFTPVAVPTLVGLQWTNISVSAWVLTVLSGVFALSVSHIIWYTGVQRLGSARTSVYSNVVPVVAMFIAGVWLLEPIGVVRVGGAAIVLTGLLLTRVETTKPQS